MKSRIWLALLTLYLVWGTTYLATHYAVESIPPFFMSGMRFLVAGLVLYTWRRMAGDAAPSRVQWRNATVIGAFLLVGGIGGVGLAQQYVPSGIAALVVAATPLWVVLIEAVLPGRTRPTLPSILGIVFGLAGIYILIDPLRATGDQHSYDLYGVAVLLLAALSWSIGSIYSHKVELPQSVLLSTGMQLLAGSLGAFIIGLATGEASRLDLAQVTVRSLGGLAYLIVIGSLVGFACYTWLLRVAPTSLVVTYAYVNPLVAVIVGSVIAQEILTTQVIIAAPLILSAVALVQAKNGEREPEQEPCLGEA